MTGKHSRSRLMAEATLRLSSARAPGLNPLCSKITGVICGSRVEKIEDRLVQKVRYLDKLIDELAKGKPMEKILAKIESSTTTIVRTRKKKSGAERIGGSDCPFICYASRMSRGSYYGEKRHL